MEQRTGLDDVPSDVGDIWLQQVADHKPEGVGGQA